MVREWAEWVVQEWAVQDSVVRVAEDADLAVAGGDKQHVLVSFNKSKAGVSVVVLTGTSSFFRVADWEE